MCVSVFGFRHNSFDSFTKYFGLLARAAQVQRRCSAASLP